MPRTRHEPDPGTIAFEDLGEALGVEATVVMEYVELGLVGPCQQAATRTLTATEIARVSRALRLARDLDLHAAAAAMLVELLEERDALRRRIACLERASGTPA